MVPKRLARGLRFFVVISMVFAGLSPRVHAASVTWSGTTSTAWGTASNWSGLSAPVNGDYVIFNTNPTSQPSNNDLSSLSLNNLTILSSTFSSSLSLGGNAFTLAAPASVTGASFARTSGTTTVTVTQANHGLTTGQFVTLSTGSANTDGVYQVTVTSGSTFTYTSGTTTALSATGTYTLAALTLSNTTVGRTTTIANNVAISGSQTWGFLANANTALIMSGNLSGSGNLTVGAGVASNSASTLPNLRLTGANNSGYTGTIAFTPTDSGVLLGSAGAMTGGLIALSGTSGNRNVWLTGGAGSGTYAFGIAGTEASGGRVQFRGAGTSGLYLTGGDVTWNPGGGTNYVWSGTGTGNTTIDFNGTNDATLRTLYLGNADGSFVVSGANKSFRNGTGGNFSGRVTLLSALSDGNEASARTLTTDLALLTLTKAAVNQSVSNRLGLTVSGGATAITDANQLPGGNVSLTGGALILDNISWAQFTAARSQGTGNGQFQFNGGGFAARTAPLTITSGTFGTANVSLGASTTVTDGSLYANQPVTISTNVALTGNRTVTVRGANVESLANWTITGPVHEISGLVSGAFTLSIDGGNATNAGGTLRLSNTSNSFSHLNVGIFNATGGSLVVLAPDDAVLGSGSVTVNAGAQGKAAMLLFENQAAGQKTFSRNFTVAMGTDASAGDQGFGSYAGDVKYSGTATITGNRTTLPVQVVSGTLRFGAGSAIVNNSSGGAQTYYKGNAGELVIDSNVSYLGTGTNIRWALAAGKITTTDLAKMTSGTSTFNAANLLGQVTVSSVDQVTITSPLRTWQVATTGTMVSDAFAYIRSIMEVPSGQAFTLDTGTNATNPSESFGNNNTTPRWNLLKAGGGDWVFTNSKRSASSAGPPNGAGFLQVGEGTLDITGDYGRGSLSVAGGTLLSGTYSPFTYSTTSGSFASGVTQSNVLEVTSAGGKIGISPSASGDVTRTVGFYWDQSGTSTLTLAARQNLNLVFSGTASTGFPDATAANTLLVERDGTGSGIVQINDPSVSVGRLGGAAQLKMGASGSGTITSLGGFHATNNTLGIQGKLVYDSAASSTFAGLLTDPSSGSNTLTKLGAGTLVISSTQTYTGKTTVGGGVLEIGSIGNVGGGATAIGNPGTAAAGMIDIGSGTSTGTLRYVGAGAAGTDRGFNLGGSSGGGGIDASGGGALVLTGSITVANGSKTFTLSGTSTAINTIGAIPNPDTGSLTVVKDGSGLWRLTGTSNFSGPFTIQNGTILTAANAPSDTGGAFGVGGAATVGDAGAGASGTAALLLEQGITVARQINVATLGSGASQKVVVGGINTSGTSTFSYLSEFRIGRSVTLVAAPGGVVNFGNTWSDAAGSGTPTSDVTIGSEGNTGTVLFNNSLTTSGSVAVRYGSLKLGPDITVSAAGTLGVDSGALLSGVGAVAGTIGGAGLVAPGNSPGILTAGAVDPSGGLDLAFEFTGLTPDYTDAANSLNDVLRLTGTSPFASSLSAINTVSLYLPAGAAAGSIYEGGFFTDRTAAQFGNFLATIGNADFVAYVADASGTVSYNGTNYSLLGLTISVGTRTVPTAGFNGGVSTVTNGQVTTFAVAVPEPAALALAGVGIAVAGWQFQRRRRG